MLSPFYAASFRFSDAVSFAMFMPNNECHMTICRGDATVMLITPLPADAAAIDIITLFSLFIRAACAMPLSLPPLMLITLLRLIISPDSFIFDFSSSYFAFAAADADAFDMLIIFSSSLRFSCQHAAD